MMRLDMDHELGRGRPSAIQPRDARNSGSKVADRLGGARSGIRSGIESISVRGFRSINLIQDLELRGTNVILGANGSGKSNFLDVFSFLRLASRGRLRYFVQKAGGADRVLHFGCSHTPVLGVQMSYRFREWQGEYSLRLKATPNDFLSPTSESIDLGGKDGQVSLMPGSRQDPYEAGMSVRSASWGGPPGVADLRDLLDGCRVYQFSDVGLGSMLTLNSELSDNRYLQADGGNLASFLFLLQRRYEHEYGLIRHAVSLVAPYFDDFVLEPTSGGKDTVRLRWQGLGQNQVMDVSALSGGVLRFVAWATVLMQPRRFLPPVVLLDEPEMGLDHCARRVLGDMINSVAKHRQVLVATQSSALLDALLPANVLVTRLRRGGTCIGRLEPSRLSGPLTRFSLGELWQKDELGRYLGDG